MTAGILKREIRGRIVNYRANMGSSLLLEMKILITLMECQKLLAELIQNASAAVKLYFEDTESAINNAECRWSRDIITVNMIFHNHSG